MSKIDVALSNCPYIGLLREQTKIIFGVNSRLIVEGHLDVFRL